MKRNLIQRKITRTKDGIIGNHRHNYAEGEKLLV